MELAVAPPPRIAASVRLPTPLVVTFSEVTVPCDGKQSPETVSTLPDLNDLWVFLSLTTADKKQSLAPPRDDLFRGRRADSVHQVRCRQGSNGYIVAYAAFTDLVITQPGSYRIMVSVLDMGAPFRGESPQEVGKVLPGLHSQVFEVTEVGDHGTWEPKLAETIGRLRLIGVDC